MGEEVVRAATRRLEQALVARLGVVHREAVDAPRLAARPAGVVVRALLGRAAQRLAGVGVPVERVEGRVVLAQDVLAQLGGVPAHRVGEALVAGLLARPREQRHVHQAVDDGAAALRGVGQVAPRLDDAGRLEEAAHEVVGGEQRRRRARPRRRAGATRRRSTACRGSRGRASRGPPPARTRRSKSAASTSAASRNASSPVSSHASHELTRARSSSSTRGCRRAPMPPAAGRSR